MTDAPHGPNKKRGDASLLPLSIDKEERLSAKSAGLLFLAMLFFATNSLFCRIALTYGQTDPLTYTVIRVASAAIILSIVVFYRNCRLPRIANIDMRSLAALVVYVLTFAFAYARVDAGVGALVLFGAVQLSMFFVGILEGERLSLLSWVGNAIALTGLVCLVQPLGSSPDAVGVMLMALSGIAWGAFSLFARGVADPLEANASNFICCLLPVAAVALVAPVNFSAAPAGVWLAVASGTASSGLGYIVWYRALQSVPATRAAIVQLCVPVLAAVGGTVLLSEPVSLRLVVASVALIGGVALALASRVIDSSC